MAFGKFRNGVTSLGRQAANWIQDGDNLSFKTRRRADGVVARKSGEFTNIYQAPAGIDGYYSLGFNGTTQRVMGSATARGVFSDRGEFVADDGSTSNSVNRLYFYSRGWAAALRFERVGSIADFNGKPAPAWQVHHAKTTNGKKFIEVFNLLNVGAFIGDNWDYPTNLSDPTVLIGGAQAAVGVGYIGITEGGQYKFVHVDDDTETVTPRVVDTVANQLAYAFNPSVTSPRTRVAAGRYMRPTYPQLTAPAPINSAACPGLVVMFSDDMGVSWTPASSTAAFDEIEDTVLPMVVPDSAANWSAVNRLFNAAMSWAGFAPPAPISRRYSLSISNVPYMVPDADKYEGFRLKLKAKIIMIDSVAKTVFETATLIDGEIEDSGYYFGSITPIAGGMLFQYKPQTQPDSRDNAIHCAFTKDGVGIVYQPPMPFPAWLTGSLFAIDTKTVGCAMYDGEYSLYESKDLGATWKKRAVISANGTPIKEPFADYLINFQSVLQLRINSQNANPMPGAPWATDERLPNPPPI